MLGKAIALLIAQQASENSDCYLQNCQFLNVFSADQDAFVVWEPLCDLETPPLES